MGLLYYLCKIVNILDNHLLFFLLLYLFILYKTSTQILYEYMFFHDSMDALHVLPLARHQIV